MRKKTSCTYGGFEERKKENAGIGGDDKIFTRVGSGNVPGFPFIEKKLENHFDS
jgi:hypothetical protein